MVKRAIFALGAMMILLLCVLPAQAAQPQCFSQEMAPTRGIWLVSLPQPGKLMLGQRQLQPGDILTWEQAETMLFYPDEPEIAVQTALIYLPLSEDGVGEAAEVAVTVSGRINQSPAAEDFALETYENLAITGKFKATDPEGEDLTFTIVRQSRRGQVTLEEDGSFTYTPKKNKAGVDSFTYTATDASGKVSRQATVTVTILKANSRETYADTLGNPCRFAAEWMKNTGIFTGETISDNPCFDPQRQVSRGQFVAMLARTLNLPTQEQSWEPEQPVAAWLKPYLAAAHRAGLTAGLNPDASLEDAITQAEAAAMVELALDLPMESQPVWAQLDQAQDQEPLTRAQAAMLLYETQKSMDAAPGMRSIRSASAQ